MTRSPGPTPPAARTATPWLGQQRFAGTIMVVIGCAAFLQARGYGLGTLQDMGPGLYPMLLGAALAVVGVLIAVVPAGADAQDGAAHGRPDWRGWSCIVLGIAAFILLGDRVGLGPATFACVFVSALGDRGATLRASLALAALTTVFAGVVFDWLLQFQLPFVQW